jgi:uncharacterized membrane protein YccC
MIPMRVSELIFKTRAIVKETTHTGRVLLKIYLDVADLFESIMTTYQQYTILHEKFDATGILEDFRQYIITISNELDELGLAIKSGVNSYSNENNLAGIKLIREHFETLRLHFMTNENVDDFISLGRILNNIEDLAEKINVLHFYTTYDKKISRAKLNDVDHNIYSESQDIRPSLFFSNLNFSSNIFRHSLRVCFALVIGYIISLFFHLGHSYWILLTIVVILKPAYSLTKTRNKDRLIGTFLGIVIGVIILFLIKNNLALLIIMIIFMATSYVFIRTNYFASVLFMTPYLVIFFHILNPGNLKVVLTDRILDTAIGSVIAFFASIFFVPQWEHVTIKFYMSQMLTANNNYFTIVANGFSDNKEINGEELKVARRNVLVALANLSDAFTRMLSEPKRFQKSTESIHHFVVLNHTLASHLSTLSYYLTSGKNNFRSADIIPVIENTELQLANAISCLDGKQAISKPDKGALQNLNEMAATLLRKRQEEVLKGELETETKKLLVQVKSVVDQFNYIFSVAAEISKSCKDISV